MLRRIQGRGRPLIGLLALALVAQNTRILPVDEATRDTSLVRFRARLVQAVERRDTAAVLAASSPRIRLSFGDDMGIPSLRDRLRRDSTLWHELHDVLTHGGRFYDDTTFTAPYWFNYPGNDADAFEHVIAIETMVPVRGRPEAGAPIISTLSREVVKRGPDDAALPAGWQSVTLRDGRRGFVLARQTRNPIGYRINLVRSGGRWLIVTFIAGD